MPHATRKLRATFTWSFLVFASIGAAACASGGAGGGGGGGGSGDVITLEQIEAFTGENAYELVRRYRARWLQPARNQNVSTTVTTRDVAPLVGDADAVSGQEVVAVVFVDGRRFGDLNSLRRIQTSSVESIEYLDARAATTRYGTGYTGGIIEVHSRGR